MIAVVVPVFNVEPYLRRCVDSILVQTYRDFNLILVDDGSYDNSGKICDEYAARDGRVTVIHKENGGLSSARNAGIRKAMAEGCVRFITFIDSDDWVDKNYLDMMCRVAAEQKAGVVACQHVTCCDDAEILPSGDSVSWKICTPSEFWRSEASHRTISCAKLYTMNLFEGVCFPEGKLNEDEFTTYRLIFKAERIADVGNCLYYYYQRPGSIMNSDWTVRRLDALDGKRAAVSFFESNNLREPWKISADDLLKNLATQAGNAKRAGEFGVAADLVKEFRFRWWEWEKELCLKKFGKNGWYYYPVYTRFEKCLWLLIRSFRILREKGIRCLFKKVYSNRKLFAKNHK